MVGISIGDITLFVFVFCAAIMDFKTGKIPNGWIALGALAGFTVNLVMGDGRNIIYCMVGSAITFGVLYPVYCIRGLGAGDVKLFMAIAWFLVGRELFYTVILSFLCGGVISIFRIIERKAGESVNDKIHFSLPILMGIVLEIGGIL